MALYATHRLRVQAARLACRPSCNLCSRFPSTLGQGCIPHALQFPSAAPHGRCPRQRSCRGGQLNYTSRDMQ